MVKLVGSGVEFPVSVLLLLLTDCEALSYIESLNLSVPIFKIEAAMVALSEGFERIKCRGNQLVPLWDSPIFTPKVLFPEKPLSG